MPDDELLPIKVLLPDPNFHIRDTAGGGGYKVFDGFSEETRGELASEVDALQQTYAEDFRAHPNLPSVAKVRLKREALAKSHRPAHLLDAGLCPIIGVGAFHELFIQVTPRGLGALAQRIRTDRTQQATANISTIEEISPLSSYDRLGIEQENEYAAMQEAVQQDGRIKVVLFDHRASAINERLLTDFREHLARLGSGVIRENTYAPSLQVLEVSATPENLGEIVAHPGVRRAGLIPQFVSLRQAALRVDGAVVPEFPLPVAGVEYPIVGLVDSGVDAGCAPLAAWQFGREDYVATAETNTSHGTFVAGILVFGEPLNGPDIADTGGPVRFLDVTVLPNGNPSRGPVGSLSEPELVSMLQSVIPRYRDQVRIWNLSLGLDHPCQDDAFSDLSIALDELQDEYGVQFVLAAGNFNAPPYRSWPPPATIGEDDRLGVPADTVRGVSVGSVAHASSVGSVVQTHEPSPFSRRGPGPAFIVKPEVVHYGGNCDATGNYRSLGIRSLDCAGLIAEDVGTSFATPLVSSLMANLSHALDPQPSLNLLKGLIVHASEYPANQGDLRYYGFGVPKGLTSIIRSTQSTATLIFEDELLPGNRLELDPFPFPACLIKNGRSTGRIKMTLAYDPPLDKNFGLEYCRANVTASLGTWGPGRDRDGSLAYNRQVPPDPMLAHQASEEDLVKYGFKWAPVKSYRREFHRGVDSTNWRLVLELLHRHDQTPSPQRFALIVTILGEDGDRVYDDLVLALRAYQTQDLALRAEVRERIQLRA